MDEAAIRIEGYNAGDRAGRQTARFREDKQREGDVEATVEAMFGGLSPEEGKYYIFRFRKHQPPGTSVVPLEAADQATMAPGTLYGICAGGDSICEHPAAPDGRPEAWRRHGVRHGTGKALQTDKATTGIEPV